eukprot:1139797-Pelagomonas_calceolata.AAC.3
MMVVCICEIATTHSQNYNRTGNVTALVGNWVEEQALKDATGLSRFETWVGQEEPSQSVHATRAVPPPMQTHPRVIEHDEAVVSFPRNVNLSTPTIAAMCC